MSATPEGTSAVLTSLSEISDHCKDIVVNAKECVEGDVEQFISKDIGKLFKVVWTYKNAFERLHVKNKAEFEEAVSHFFRFGKVRELFDEVLENEQAWDEFLREVDSQLVVSNEKPLTEGDQAPINLSRVLSQANCKVLLVSFGEEYGAKRWFEETGSFFDMILDPQRKIYQAFGLNRSVFKVWSIECMCFYADKLLAGRQFPKPLENVHDDPQQMGGDFVLDASGKVIFTYCSQTSSDRPSMETLLSVIRRKRSIEKTEKELEDEGPPWKKEKTSPSTSF